MKNLGHGVRVSEEPVWRALVLSSRAEDGPPILQPTARDEKEGQAQSLSPGW